MLRGPRKSWKSVNSRNNKSFLDIEEQPDGKILDNLKNASCTLSFMGPSKKKNFLVWKSPGNLFLKMGTNPEFTT